MRSQQTTKRGRGRGKRKEKLTQLPNEKEGNERESRKNEKKESSKVEKNGRAPEQNGKPF